MIIGSSTAGVPIPNKNNISVAFGGGSFSGVEATGGTETTDGDYKVHTFLNSDDDFEVTAVGDNDTV